jgi:anti-anti-sigma regulatory factor
MGQAATPSSFAPVSTPHVCEADANVFLLSGVLDADHAARLEDLLAAERDGRIVVVLGDVTLVDREAVRFLARVETAGTEIVDCPEHVRSWIAAEGEGRGP